jgi:hypothetical protein
MLDRSLPSSITMTSSSPECRRGLSSTIIVSRMTRGDRDLGRSGGGPGMGNRSSVTILSSTIWERRRGLRERLTCRISSTYPDDRLERRERGDRERG